MSIERRNYAQGTWVKVRYPWGVFVGARVLCADGRVRKVKRIAETADSFFSVPAAVTVAGRTVSGYVTVETVGGSSVARFVANRYGRNGHLLSGGVS